MDNDVDNEKRYKLINVWEASIIPSETPFIERRKFLEMKSKISDVPFKSELCTIQTDMPIHEEIIVMLSWFIFFSFALYGPLFIIILLFIKFKIAITIIIVCCTVSLVPSPFTPSICYHYIATLNLKYFSYRTIWKTTIPPGKTCIGVTPPHGLFPIGGILGIFAMPRFAGFCGRGVAATAILYFPFIGNFLRMIGCIDATRENCIYYLERGQSIGLYMYMKLYVIYVKLY